MCFFSFFERIRRLAVPPQFRRLTRLHSAPAFPRCGTLALLRLLRPGLGVRSNQKNVGFAMNIRDR